MSKDDALRAAPSCPQHGRRFTFERRGIGCTEFVCVRCQWKSGGILTELFQATASPYDVSGNPTKEYPGE